MHQQSVGVLSGGICVNGKVATCGEMFDAILDILVRECADAKN